MTAFVESCVETVAGSAVAVERRTRGRPRARKLLKLLENKKNILVTTHRHPDPDALASSHALTYLLRENLKNAKVSMSVKGRVGGGINDAFTKLATFSLTPWDDATLDQYDAVVLLDCQPLFAYSPLPPEIIPLAVIDHHRAPGHKPKCPFCDVRTDVGATCSIVFSYFMELETPIPRDLGATLLFAIESDLAGAAGTPGELDNIALSSLTLIADTRKLYEMRYVDLPQSYYVAYAQALATATYFDNAIIAHLDTIESPELPAVVADGLLRFDKVQWALVTALYEGKLILSLRTSSRILSTSDVVRKLLRNYGEGGGHRTKAGGYVRLEEGTEKEIAHRRDVLRRRFLRVLGIKSRGQKLVPPKNQ